MIAKKDLPELPSGYQWMKAHTTEQWAAFHPKNGDYIKPGQGKIASIVDKVNEIRE